MAKAQARSFQIPDKQKLKSDLESLRYEVAGLDTGDLLTGQWFPTFLPRLLTAYSNEPPVEGVPEEPEERDELAKELVDEAARLVAHVGGTISHDVGTSEAQAIAQGRLVAGRKVSPGTASILGEVLYGLRMDMKLLGYLSAIYSAPLRTDDPMEVLTLLDLALYADLAEAEAKAFRKASAEQAGENIGGLVEKGTFEAMPERAPDELAKELGQRLFRRAVVKTVVPRVSVPLLKGFLCFITKALGKVATRKMKKLGVLHKDVAKLIKDEVRGERFLLPLVMSMSLVDGELHETELAVFREALTKLEVDDREREYLTDLATKGKEAILEDLKGQTDKAMKEVFYEALVLTALADGKLHPYEKDYLREVCGALGFSYDEKALDRRLRGYDLAK